MDWFYQDDSLPGRDTKKVNVSQQDAPLTVSEVSNIIESLLDNHQLQEINVLGEVTNYKHHHRGHRYFTLSEKSGGITPAVIKCVMWKSDADKLSFDPEDGMEVIVTGSVRVYPPQGSYQLQIKRMTRGGIGERFLLIEKWKRELTAEGCFSLERKRSLPRFPQRIGVVTSATGAVIHDIRTVIARRFPVEIILSPTAVQGDDAHLFIARAISRVGRIADVVIIARGGGSFEDLFPFNHPDVIRAIVSCPVPVISAIGHEVDVTLADLAADVRAPTPSAAAEIVVPDRKDLQIALEEMQNKLDVSLISLLNRSKKEVAGLKDRLRPQRFNRLVEEKRQLVTDLFDRLEHASTIRIERDKLMLAEMRTRLELGNPRAVLSRGYCVAEKDGSIVKSVTNLKKDDRLNIRFSDGRSRVITEGVEYDGNL